MVEKRQVSLVIDLHHKDGHNRYEQPTIDNLMESNNH